MANALICDTFCASFSRLLTQADKLDYSVQLRLSRRISRAKVFLNDLTCQTLARILFADFTCFPYFTRNKRWEKFIILLLEIACGQFKDPFTRIVGDMDAGF